MPLLLESIKSMAKKQITHYSSSRTKSVSLTQPFIPVETSTYAQPDAFRITFRGLDLETLASWSEDGEGVACRDVSFLLTTHSAWFNDLNIPPPIK